MGQLDHAQWKRTSREIDRQVRRFVRRYGRLPKATYSDGLILKIYCWLVLKNLPLARAADPDIYDRRVFRPQALPSRSQFGRRVDTPRFDTLLSLIHPAILGPLDPSDGGKLDGKPLVVGVASKDKDAARGKVMGGFAKGYKLHVWSLADRRIGLWSLMPLNVAETLVAEALIAQMPRFTARALTLGDGNYDSQRLYRALEEKNGALLSKPRGLDLRAPQEWCEKRKHRHPKSKEDSPARAAAMAVWEASPWIGRYVYQERIAVEGTLSSLCSHVGGLGPLPAWVRTLRRVRRWVGVKIILFNARLSAQHALAEAA